MSRLQSVKMFVQQRLSAAVDEILIHLESTMSQYEEEMVRRYQLDTVSDPKEKLQRAEVQHQWLIKEEQQEEPEQPDIKEEQEDFWSSQEVRSHLQGLQEEEHILGFSFTPVLVKSEDNEDEAHSSPLHQRHSEEERKAEPPTSSSTQQMKREAGGEECGGSDPDRVLVSHFKCLSGSDDKTSHNEESVDGMATRKPQTHLNTMKNKVPVRDMGGYTGKKLFSCSKCDKRFGQKHHLQTHMRCHTGEKPFSCSLCGKKFTQKGNLTQHLTVHTREKPCSCPVCGERFAQKGNLTQHMTVHTREKVCERLTNPGQTKLSY
ncbi:zinc finger protein 260-like isoform X2 [Centropristis striata]|uniref:zinc finger protein 260-like isoform X2 n=1 Tax=Centropristis striata TaxID=184440 RepID=UPI0027E0F2BD|nr:zinc finger protein 260-like isoform X2 [Centropristis striata]